MRSSLERDLARWERSELSAAALERHHPGRAAALVAVYERLTDLGNAAVPDPRPGWERLRERLVDRPVVLLDRRRGPMIRRLVARPLAAAVAAILLAGAAGYAAAPRAVNHRLTAVWRSVESLFQVEPIRSGRPERSPAPHRGGGPGVVPSDSDDEVGHEDGDEVGDDEDEQEDGDDEGEKYSEGSDDGTDDDSSDASGDDSPSEEGSLGGGDEEIEEDPDDD